MIHGASRAKKISAETAAPANQGRPARLSLHASHKPQHGNSVRQEGLASARMPQVNPNQTHVRIRGSRSSHSVSKSTSESANAEKLVSHTHRTAQYIEYGSSAQVHPAHRAMRSPTVS